MCFHPKGTFGKSSPQRYLGMIPQAYLESSDRVNWITCYIRTDCEVIVIFVSGIAKQFIIVARINYYKIRTREGLDERNAPNITLYRSSKNANVSLSVISSVFNMYTFEIGFLFLLEALFCYSGLSTE